MNTYIDKLYKDVHDNRYNLEALQGMLWAIDKHEDDLCWLYCLIKDRVDALLDYERQFNTPANNVNRGVTVISPNWEPLMSFKTIKEAAHSCWVNPKSASNVLQKKQSTAWDWYSFVWADEI